MTIKKKKRGLLLAKSRHVRITGFWTHFRRHVYKTIASHICSQLVQLSSSRNSSSLHNFLRNNTSKHVTQVLLSNAHRELFRLDLTHSTNSRSSVSDNIDFNTAFHLKLLDDFCKRLSFPLHSQQHPQLLHHNHSAWQEAKQNRP